MPLSAGDTLGPYEILTPIGTGWGEVLAAEAILLALLADDGPTGTYSDSKGIVPW